jgi:sulfonate transport system permease protein
MSALSQKKRAGAMSEKRASARVLRFGLLPVALLILWQAGAGLGLLPVYLVAPSAIAETAWAMLLKGELGRNLGVSLLRCYGGFAIGAGTGVALGLLTGRSASARALIDPLVSVTYPAPKIAILPILMVWLGLGDASKIALISISVFYPAYINAFQGAVSVKPVLIAAARTMGAGRLTILARVVAPAAMPSILIGLRVALGLSFIMLFAAELAGADKGLGRLIVDAQMFQRFDIMFVAVFAIALFGFASDRFLLTLRDRFFSHHGGASR